MAANFFLGRSSVSNIVGQDLDSKICVASYEKGSNEEYRLFSTYNENFYTSDLNLG